MKLEDIDQAVYTIWERIWSLAWLRPVNQDEEMKKFLASDDYEPQFEYKELDFDADEYVQQLQDLKKELANTKDKVGILLLHKIDKLLDWLGMLKSRGKKEFTQYSLEYYGKPDERLVTKAKELLELDDSAEEQPLTAKDAIPKLQQAAKDMLLDWKVVAKKELGSRADCVIPEKTLYIREDAKFSEKDIMKLAVHELGVHARRAENGREQHFKLFLMGTALYEATEEGLAGFVEESAGLSTQRSMKRKGALVVIVDSALQHGFRKIYDLIKEYFPAESAFRLVTKAKRGLGDTGMPGAFTKDHIYLKGLELVKNVDDIDALFIGRVAVEDLGMLN